jgi:hypothetical protein
VPLTDLSDLQQFCKGDRARMEKYIRMYLSTATTSFAQLGERLSADDAAGLALVAHSLRPQVIHMGARTVIDKLAAIEQCARTEGTAACKPLIDEVLALSAQVDAELRSQLSAGPSA